MTELLFLFLIELIGFGAKELSFQIGNDRLGFGQLLRPQREFLFRAGQGLILLGQLLLQLPNIFQ